MSTLSVLASLKGGSIPLVNQVSPNMRYFSELVPRKIANAKKIVQVKECKSLLWQIPFTSLKVLMGFAGSIGYLEPYVSTPDMR